MVSLRSRRQVAVHGGGGLVASAQPVRLDRKPDRTPKQDDRQKQAWGFYDTVPEVKELFLWRGNQIAKLRLVIAAHPDGDMDAEPVPASDPASGIPTDVAQRASDALHRLRSRMGGQAEVLRRLEINLECCGEAYVVGFGERVPTPGTTDEYQPEEWTVASIDEVAFKAGTGRDDPGTWTVKRHPSDKTGRPLDPARDDIFRVWMPHGRWGEMADCAMLGVLGELETLQVLCAQLKAEAQSRVPAGLFTVPNELTIGNAAPADPDADGQENAPQESFMETLVNAWVGAIEDPSNVASLAPLLVRGPKDALGSDVLRFIDMSRQTDGTLDTRIDARIDRLARGLDAPVEVMKGHAETTFSNAKEIDIATWEDYLEPRAVLLCDAFTVGYLRPRLIAEGVDPAVAERLFVWYDASDLIPQPNPQDSATEGVNNGSISWAAWRRAMGFAEDDAPDVLELLSRTALRRGGMDAGLTTALIELLEGVPDLPDPLPAEGNPTAAGPMNIQVLRALLAQQAQAHRTHPPAQLARPALAARARQVGRNPGQDLVAIDRDLRLRLLVASDGSLTRALERAGNKLKNAKSHRDTLRRVPPGECAAHLGPTLVAAGGNTPDELLEGAFDALGTQFMQWGAGAQAQAIEVVNRLVGFTGAERDALGLRMAASLTEAWGWMRENLTALAEARLFTPHPAAAPFGEFDPSLRVPPGLVRQAIARAGGAVGLSTNGAGSAWVALVDGGTRPAGGIATGEIMRGALRDNGVATEAYVWDYGPAQRARPFLPHMQLDGTQFTNFDDSVLANTEGWPEFGFFAPGDHDGCMCDATPILVPPPA